MHPNPFEPQPLNLEPLHDTRLELQNCKAHLSLVEAERKTAYLKGLSEGRQRLEEIRRIVGSVVGATAEAVRAVVLPLLDRELDSLRRMTPSCCVTKKEGS